MARLSAVRTQVSEGTCHPCSPSPPTTIFSSDCLNQRGGYNKVTWMRSPMKSKGKPRAEKGSCGELLGRPGQSGSWFLSLRSHVILLLLLQTSSLHWRFQMLRALSPRVGRWPRQPALTLTQAYRAGHRRPSQHSQHSKAQTLWKGSVWPCLGQMSTTGPISGGGRQV